MKDGSWEWRAGESTNISFFIYGRGKTKEEATEKAKEFFNRNKSSANPDRSD